MLFHPVRSIISYWNQASNTLGLTWNQDLDLDVEKKSPHGSRGHQEVNGIIKKIYFSMWMYLSLLEISDMVIKY